MSENAEIKDNPPMYVQEDIQGLRESLNRTIVSKKIVDQNLLIATWNIRAFGGLTEKWESDENDSPKRDLHSLRCIAEIISRFDIIAIQEVRADLKALRHLMKELGPDWGVMLTDTTKGKRGNNERLAFLFDRRRIRLSGLACEIVIAPEIIETNRELGDKIQQQFARTPYAVGFISGDKTFILVTMHVIWGKEDELGLREDELEAIADWMTEWAKDTNAWDHNLILLGDFNIDRDQSELYQKFTEKGLRIPTYLRDLPRTIFDGETPNPEKFYDQIAWFTGVNDTPALSLIPRTGGHFDFTKCVLTDRNLDLESLSWYISDHYPLYIEFGIVTDPTEVPSDQEAMEDARRKIKAKIPTAMENAIIAILYEIEHNNHTYTEDFEEHLVDILFHERTINACNDKIQRLTYFSKVPEKIVNAAFRVVDEILSQLEHENRKEATQTDIDNAIRTLKGKSWPFDIGLKYL